ncbi:tetratricopeptide repeat protein [Pseudorhodoferax sp.]|uniref:tetratricopeptide repeat protein n=1 Tax=Pseudorhodoferax sp. TaxID=1993553 RepID=UPI002DD6258E|nr:tetratricopeptide repeat protein [Pseudorhodoferax sp.]
MHLDEPTPPAAAPSPLRANLERLLAAGRDGALLRFGLGQALLREGQPLAAAEHLREATRQDPGYSAAWKLLGKVLDQLGSGDEAEAAWHEGLAVAGQRGDMQSVKEITVFLKRLRRTRAGDAGA